MRGNPARLGRQWVPRVHHALLVFSLFPHSIPRAKCWHHRYQIQGLSTGQNSYFSGNVKNEYFHFDAVTDIDGFTRVLLLLVFIDALSLVIAATVLKLTCNMNMLQVPSWLLQRSLRLNKPMSALVATMTTVAHNKQKQHSFNGKISFALSQPYVLCSLPSF